MIRLVDGNMPASPSAEIPLEAERIAQILGFKEAGALHLPIGLVGMRRGVYLKYSLRVSGDSGGRSSGSIFCLPDIQRVHGHRPGTAIDEVDGVFALSQPAHFADQLLRLARAGGRQIRGRPDFSVNLNFDFSGARFLGRDHRDEAAGER